MTRHPFNPACQACADPERLQCWLADQRIHANELSERAKHRRVAGDDARKRNLAAPVSSPEFRQTQAEMLRLYGEANAAAQRAMFLRADADRVEEAHPEVPQGAPTQPVSYTAPLFGLAESSS